VRGAGRAATSGEDSEGYGRRAAPSCEASGELEIDIGVECEKERLDRAIAVADELGDPPFVDPVFLGSEGTLTCCIDHQRLRR
jgi:hypothetical protein